MNSSTRAYQSEISNRSGETGAYVTHLSRGETNALGTRMSDRHHKRNGICLDRTSTKPSTSPGINPENAVVNVHPDVPFKTLIAIVLPNPVLLPKRAIVEIARQCPSFIALSGLTVDLLLGGK